jgi:hypothetical protein
MHTIIGYTFDDGSKHPAHYFAAYFFGHGFPVNPILNSTDVDQKRNNPADKRAPRAKITVG